MSDGIIIGSHNTMSYLPPRYWWMRPFRFLAKCQSKTLLEQLDARAEAVDLRVCFDRKGVAQFAHGAMTFQCHVPFEKVLDRLPPYTAVRLILERERRASDERQFMRLCRAVESAYPWLAFFGGYSKRPWCKLYTFKSEENGELPLHQHVGSMAIDARWYEKIIPALYHRRKGHARPSAGINLYDFI